MDLSEITTVDQQGFEGDSAAKIVLAGMDDVLQKWILCTLKRTPSQRNKAQETTCVIQSDTWSECVDEGVNRSDDAIVVVMRGMG